MFYTPEEFLIEAARMGISKKVWCLPRGFKIDETVVYLAHIEACLKEDKETDEWEHTPGVFTCFTPSSVDLVIDDPENIPEKAIKLATKLGDYARIVKVEPIIEPTSLVEDEPSV
jgi:hypothetical protein